MGLRLADSFRFTPPPFETLLRVTAIAAARFDPFPSFLRSNSLWHRLALFIGLHPLASRC